MDGAHTAGLCVAPSKKLETPMNSNRRKFLKTSAAIASVPFIPWTRTVFANKAKNDRPRIACIGTGSMGMGDAQAHSEFGDILAVCDVDRRHAEQAKNDPKVGK